MALDNWTLSLDVDLGESMVQAASLVLGLECVDAGVHGSGGGWVGGCSAPVATTQHVLRRGKPALGQLLHSVRGLLERPAHRQHSQRAPRALL